MTTLDTRTQNPALTYEDRVKQLNNQSKTDLTHVLVDLTLDGATIKYREFPAIAIDSLTLQVLVAEGIDRMLPYGRASGNATNSQIASYLSSWQAGWSSPARYVYWNARNKDASSQTNHTDLAQWVALEILQVLPTIKIGNLQSVAKSIKYNEIVDSSFNSMSKFLTYCKLHLAKVERSTLQVLAKDYLTEEKQEIFQNMLTQENDRIRAENEVKKRAEELKTALEGVAFESIETSDNKRFTASVAFADYPAAIAALDLTPNVKITTKGEVNDAGTGLTISFSLVDSDE